MVQSTLSLMYLMERPLGPGKDFNTQFNSLQISTDIASGSVLIVPLSSGASEALLQTPHNGHSTSVKTQCKPLTSKSDGPPGIQGLKGMRLQISLQASVLYESNGMLAWLQNLQYVGFGRSIRICEGMRSAPGGKSVVPNSLSGIGNGDLIIELSCCQSLSSLAQYF